MFLEDGEWASADEYCEKVLDLEPQNAMAYVGKLLTELRITNLENLADASKPFDNNSNYLKALRFANTSLIEKLECSCAVVQQRCEEERLERENKEIYDKAISLTASKKELSYAERLYGSYGGRSHQKITADDYFSAAKLLDTIPGYRDADSLAEQYRKTAHTMVSDAAYAEAFRYAYSQTVAELQKAVDILDTMPGYKNADSVKQTCLEKIQQITAEQQVRKHQQDQQHVWRASGHCQHCGGELKGLFGKKCANCGKAKDY
jgi:hypothetical protein